MQKILKHANCGKQNSVLKIEELVLTLPIYVLGW